MVETVSPEHAFISYSRKDTAFVERLEAKLNRRGIVTWRDTTSIPSGDDWYRNIITGLARAYAVLCIVTPNADESKWVRREQLRADEDDIPPIAVHPARHRNPLHLQEVPADSDGRRQFCVRTCAGDRRAQPLQTKAAHAPCPACTHCAR